MAMLRVLSEKMTHTFAIGEPVEYIQCRMLEAALDTKVLIKKHKL